MTTPAQLAGMFNRLSSLDIVPHQHRCVRVRNRHAACRACADACTSGCISFENGQLTVDHSKCVGCGTCATVCPTCALEAARPNDAALLAQARRALRATDGLVVFASEGTLAASADAFDPAKVVGLVNLGRVEETLLVQLARAGARRIVLVQPAVADETDLMGAKTAALVCASANAILAAWGCATRASMAERLPAEVLLDGPAAPCGQNAGGAEARPEQASRRDRGSRPDGDPAGNGQQASTRQGGTQQDSALQGGTQQDSALQGGTPQAVYHRIKVMKDGTLPHFTPDRREGLLDALFEMGEPVHETVVARIWGHVVIDPARCTGCRMCAAFCPTGALFKYRDADGSTGVEHSPGDCVKCLCCQDVCRFDAIRIEDQVRPRDVLSGAVERYEMPPEELFRTNEHSIINAVKKSFKTERIYER